MLFDIKLRYFKIVLTASKLLVIEIRTIPAN